MTVKYCILYYREKYFNKKYSFNMLFMYSSLAFVHFFIFLKGTCYKLIEPGNYFVLYLF